MKNILKISAYCLIAILLFNCSSDDKTIDSIFDNIQSGATLRTIKVNQANFDFYDSSSEWSITVEEQDINNGGLFSEIKIYTKHTSEGVSSDEVFVKSIPASNFKTTGYNKYPQGEISTTLDEILTALNLSSGDYTPSDKFNLRLELILTNGQTFSSKNTSSSITGGTYFSSPFEYSAQFSCPLSDASLFDGDYEVITDAWADYGTGDTVPVVYNVANGSYSFRIMNTNNPYLVNEDTAYLTVTINPADNTVTVTSNEAYNYGGGYIADVTGSGTIGSCTGDINLKLNFVGIADNQTFNLVKK